MKHNFLYSLLIFLVTAGVIFAAEKQFVSEFHVAAEDWITSGY